MITHRNTGHDWQFTPEQQHKLQQYYDANKLLADCLNSECYVTKPVRAAIEDTMLFPLPPSPRRGELHAPPGCNAPQRDSTTCDRPLA